MNQRKQIRRAKKLLRKVVVKILKEHKNQNKLWGYPHARSDTTWLAILGEEFGEVCRASLGNPDAGDIEEELVQVAAICVSWLVLLGGEPEGVTNEPV
jgi:NTP pyrophosphatase (non-canonical NTP hydrolase)